ncbi:MULTISPECIES: DUF2304 domain-containing protein [unclassified Breznakia]|uniref:DUF2304 domain-containing protein n=1 Tax=unclassified Breznakia TaxID=2623764 RepID=UPI002475421C|nr:MULTISPECIES: DUF2304 domain-containing protein [unclassified Breznakia]MDH6367896.1 hypothetical protein [Breznakia sp. PH1-1]MDH6404984.1 hypothetical protein [Breznakia sp. PF1-11]MDH6412705.1 hypothetical protein [Breznakia sp. PFB1-11]MDH6415059.1 hypothetical protein [Breznakia sp. PFB1-14]MDH6417370.1 hypothetical protein [Breznakia sp. PFB1-4]
MSSHLRVGVFLGGLIILLIILHLLKKGRVPIKFSIPWFLAPLLLFLVALFPDVVVLFTQFLGFQTMANMVIGILIFILIILSISLTVIVSGQKTKIQLLIQEVSIMKSELEKVSKNKTHSEE